MTEPTTDPIAETDPIADLTSDRKPVDRRSFLQLLTTGAAAAAFPSSIARALATPANNRTGTIRDVQHIVIMMQENRSFDHYFGTLRGVRGFGDPRAVQLPSGKSVWHQPNPGNADGYTLPFHPGAPNLGLQFLKDLAHDWTTTQRAWNQGRYDQWVPNKSATTMAYLTRSDIPFHYALADAFTVCDAYYCSLLGPTDPNRYHMWTGWVGNDGKNGGPVIDNAELGYDWSTYPERLEKAGISWKIYQDIGTGLDAAGFWGSAHDPYIGNYGDNSLLYFHQYQSAEAGSPLADRAKSGTNIAKNGTLFDHFANDVRNGTLPQISWIAAPEAYTEHPNWPANYGAWYLSSILDALTANPEVWSRTAFFYLFDENDGFFDHMIPPTPPQSRTEGISNIPTTNEIFTGSPHYPTASHPAGPYGLGVRVPMIVVSPWSKGGYVDSQVFDHTSLIRFVEERFGSEHPGLREPNITEWRRAVAGDLTSAFNFANPNDAMAPLPSTIAYLPPDNARHPDYVPAPPTQQALPIQEPGIRHARALPYELEVSGQVDSTENTLRLRFANTGAAAAVFHVRNHIGGEDSRSGPWTYTVSPRAEVSDLWKFQDDQPYELAIHGPNGFYRSFKGKISKTSSAKLDLDARCDASTLSIALTLRNTGATSGIVTVVDGYTGKKSVHTLAGGRSVRESWPLAGSSGWYDLVVAADFDPAFESRLAGHIENGRESTTDPAIGGR